MILIDFYIPGFVYYRILNQFINTSAFKNFGLKEIPLPLWSFIDFELDAKIVL